MCWTCRVAAKRPNPPVIQPSQAPTNNQTRTVLFTMSDISGSEEEEEDMPLPIGSVSINGGTAVNAINLTSDTESD
jgi:hypothetical protein